MAVAFGSAGTFATYASHANTTLVAPSSIADGDLLLAYVAIGGTPAATVTAPGGWTALTGSPTNISSDSGFNVKYFIWYKIASSEAGNYTFTHSTSNTCGIVVRYTGVDTSTPFSPTPTTNTGGADVATATGFTTTVANTFVIFTEHDWSDNSNNTVVPTGTTPTFTERLDDNLIYIADGTLASAGATGDKSHTCNSSTSFANSKWGAYLIGLKPSSGVAPSGTLAATEAADVASFAGLVGRSGTLAASESPDYFNSVEPILFEAWWNFASAAVDATGHGNDGTLHGTTLTTDPYGRAARGFNGTTDYIDGSSSPLEP